MKRLIRKVIPKCLLKTAKIKFYKLFGHNHINMRKSNTLVLGDSLLRNCIINVRGRNNRIEIGNNNSLINSRIEIFGDNGLIIIGHNNLIKDSILWLEDSCSGIIIGNDNKFCSKTHMGVVEGTKLTIGNDCLFSSEIYITTTDSHSIIDIKTGKRINHSSDVCLGNHIWVGHKATVLKGVTIADDTIVGACSVVTHSITIPHTAVAGNPARTVSDNISWDEHRI